MRRAAKRAGIVICMLTLMLCLTGCLKSVDQMYVLPKTAEENEELQSKLDAMRERGAEYIQPLSGDTRQSSIVVDLDGDETDETVYFFRDKNAELPLQVVVFWRPNPQKNSFYTYTISGKGESIDSFSCSDLDGDGSMELIIGWREGPNDKNLEVYSAHKETAQSSGESEFTFELLQTTNYSDYRLCKFSEKSEPDVTNLFVIRRKMNDTGAASATEREAVLYTVRSGADGYEIRTDGPAPLSSVRSVQNIIISKLSNGTAAAYVDSESYYGGYLTDIVTFFRHELVNLIKLNESAKPTAGDSSNSAFIETFRPVKMLCTDIDGDGIIELPIFEKLNTANRFSPEYAIRWYAYSTSSSVLKLTTYYNPDDTWYFILPNNQLDKLYVRRENAYGVQSVVFSYKSDSVDTDILKITAYRGDMRNQYEELSGGGQKHRLAEGENTEALYIGEVLSGEFWELTSMIELKFKLSYPEWSAE